MIASKRVTLSKPGKQEAEPPRAQRTRDHSAADRAQPRAGAEVSRHAPQTRAFPDTGGFEELSAASDPRNPGPPVEAAGGADGSGDGSGAGAGTDPFYRRTEPAGTGGGAGHQKRFRRRFCNPCARERASSWLRPLMRPRKREAIARLRRLCEPEVPEAVEAGHAVAFASSKPGSGASTLATQTAFCAASIDRQEGAAGRLRSDRRHHWLLPEVEPQLFAGGCAAARRASGCRRCGARWRSITAAWTFCRLRPRRMPIRSTARRLRMLIDQARQMYDWVILDLPTVFSQTSLMAISECERAFWFPPPNCPACI